MECPVCDREFGREGSLKQHCRDSHPRTFCLRCERPFANRVSLRQHISSSSNHHRCEHCPHKPDFVSSTALEEHQKTPHKLCKPCDRSFKSLESLQQHELDVHNLCKDCGEAFDTENSLHYVCGPINAAGCRLYIDILHSIKGHMPRNLFHVQDALEASTRSQRWCYTLRLDHAHRV